MHAVLDSVASPGQSTRLRAFLDERAPATPCLVVDLDVVRTNYHAMRAALPEATIFYAVKANPAPEVVAALAAEGSSFDVASTGEIDLCLAQGADPESLSYGNPIKKAADIAYAYRRGVRRYTFDSDGDLANLAEHAPGSRVWCRFLVDAPQSGTPFGKKFGCAPEMALRLLARAADLGLVVDGACFHVGSQHTDAAAWTSGIAEAGRIARGLAEAGVATRSLNLGGGFPASYRDAAPPLAVHAEAIRTAVAEHFDTAPELVVEPGRAIVATAGVIRAEVVLVSRKSDHDEHRWVYLDIGRYSGLAETENEYIAYRLRTAHPPTPDGPVIIAGPTCDGDDVIYQNTPYRLPTALRAGDHVDILDAGAYTASYSSVSFNGFPPLPTLFVG
ncbi:type III PLP-dependent enzyme [Actinokineospora auranticolor]|uniref:ornithine decarboxylase n=1 Tax=Actinokineospora auranticolor TaxID=155976 RepID=A0A2S6GBP7_9PSEU|nr:type III PLP-dependent enzyme [Actinokineospora auranticolor]PPK61592.1 ornithine decarboxylase [Actinokineospora auranticolor]